MHLSLCICALIPRITVRTRLVLLLHQLEESKPTNTGQLAARCLTNSAVTAQGGGGAASLWQGTQPVLLYPHQDARPLATWRDHPLPITLVVPDGTWRQANKARRRVDGLADLPCVVVPYETRSRYRLRHAATPDRLSTMEAVAVAMGILEGVEVEQQLQHILHIMVERTLWTNGRIRAEEVTGGIPPGVRPHDPWSGTGADGKRAGGATAD
jgi:DTW domain-containing protein YfiP